MCFRFVGFFHGFLCLLLAYARHHAACRSVLQRRMGNLEMALKGANFQRKFTWNIVGCADAVLQYPARSVG